MPDNFRVNGIWSGGNVAGPIYEDVGSAALPAYSFQGYPGTGWRTRVGILCGSVAGSAELEIYTSGIEFKAATVLSWSASADPSASVDAGISRTSAGLIEINNGTTGTLRDFKARAATFSGTLTLAGGTLLATSSALTNGAAAQTATLTNGPTAGNPTKWVPINDNGTTRYIPAW